MNKKGFTLIELLGTVIILVIIALVAFPAILSLLDTSESETNETMKNLLISAATTYVNDNVEDYPKQLANTEAIKEYGAIGNITGQELIEKAYISSTEINENKHCEFLDDYVKVTSNSQRYFYEYVEVEANTGCSA